MTFITAFRHNYSKGRSDYRSINPDFILVSIVSSCLSVATWQLVDLWLSRHAILPVRFPFQISRVMIGYYFKEHKPNLLPKRYLLYTHTGAVMVKDIVHHFVFKQTTHPQAGKQQHNISGG